MILSFLSAPMYCETTTPAPTAAPCAKAIIKFISAVPEPTAANPLLPTKLPTMIESAVLYIC